MLQTHLLLAVLWITYCVLHSVLASLTVKTRVQKFAGVYFRHYRLFYTVFAAVSLVAIVYFQLRIQSTELLTTTLFSKIAGSLLGLIGISIMLVCIKKYFVSLSGIKSLVQETPSTELMIAGIHRYIRHPLYLGTFLAIWGLWLLFPTLSLFISNVVITAYTLYAIQLEEEKLIAEFGEQYREYQKRVPKLIPRF
ncbi:MAG TPA: isoprenylcysteine carboxylmethyltransferase family protein [Flavisolibacter sp.]|jgi:protein-S-isoprenylcysteine O-methyltransferase Ste14|nr:isoprenylcysteine carboxylmethyltransferase family protein [Flavisolibacter sp.]